jgi:predicted short-subunit dehydrogenase-like oxidoreductase (DUF2520 family)
MSSPNLVALAGAGPVARSPLARHLPGRLGPVKSASLRLASRIVNSLRAGYPVKTYSDFRGCRVVLCIAPDAAVPAIVEELSAAPLEWRNCAVLLCDSTLDSAALARLAACGASVASLNEVPGFDGSRFVVEGGRPAVRAVRQLLAHPEVRIHELKPAAKAEFFAGVTFAGELLTPLAYAALASFRLSGLQGEQAAVVLERIVERTLRAFLKAGKSGWSGPLASGNSKEILRQIAALQRINPLLAESLKHNAAQALRLFGRDLSWMSAE